MIPISDDNPHDACRLSPGPSDRLCCGVPVAALASTRQRFEATIRSLGFTPRDFFGPAATRGEWLTICHLDVPARRADASRRQHALPLDLREQRRRRHGPCRGFSSSIWSAAWRPRSRRRLSEPRTTIPMVGASGAISGVLGAYVLIYPRARITVIIPLGVLLYPTKISSVYRGRVLVRPAADQRGDGRTRDARRRVARPCRGLCGRHPADAVACRSFRCSDGILAARGVRRLGTAFAVVRKAPHRQAKLAQADTAAPRTTDMKHRNNHFAVGYWSLIRRGTPRAGSSRTSIPRP